jgi:hypothetical protein
MRIARLNDEEMMLASETNNNMKVSMLQMFPAQSSIYNGDHENIRGFASIEFDTLIPTPQVAFSVKGNHSEFITIIGINKTTKSLKEYLSTIIKITPEKISLTKEKNTLGEIRRIQTKTQ